MEPGATTSGCKSMKLLIIQPTHFHSKSNRKLHKTKRRSLVGLTLPYLAALTPPEWEVTLIDEQLNDVDFNAAVDLVAITTWTISSLRAYEIADRFRQRGVPVIMGGAHTFFFEEEAAEHCDSVGVGEGETLWPIMLADAAAGKLQKVYRSEGMHSLGRLPLPRYDLMNLRPYGLIKTFSIQSSRGCPFKCEFCSERFYLGTSYRYRPTEEVVEEIKHTGVKNIFFADSHFAGKISHTMELMEALIPLKLRWSALWSTHLCKNDEFMNLAKRSGLLHVNIGMESIDSDTLQLMNKKANKVNEYEQVLDGLRKRGISYSLNFIFGWDNETEEVFDRTLTFLKDHKVPVVYFNVLTPYKGTPLFDRMKAEGRIVNIDEMGRWPGLITYIKPKNYSAATLENRVKGMYTDFYSYPCMLARLPLPVTKANLASWFINFSQRKAAREETENFDAY